MSYIDMLYAQAFPDYKRKPANAAFDQVLTSGQKAPAGTNFVGDLTAEDMAILDNPISQEQYKALPGPKIATPQPQTSIAAEVPMPIEYPTGYKVQVPQSEIIRQNVNEALQRQIQERDALASNVKGAYSERESNKKSMMDALERMRSLSDETYQSPEIDAQIKTLSEKSSMPDLPERSALADIISLFGAPVLGAMTGEAGALAQVPAGRAARDIYEGAHKQEIERVKLLKENTEKKVKALIDMKKASQDSFDKSQARQLEKVKAELGATKELTSMSADDLKNQEEKLFRLNDAITKEIGGRSTDIAKMDRSKWESEQKTKRAPRLQKPPDLPLDKKKMVEKYATDVARITGINSQVSELKRQIGDKSLPETDRVASANEQLKLLNSTLGADAVGAEEVGRMAAYLEFKPNYVKRKLGPDLEGFYRQLDRVNQRLSGTISAQQREIDKIYGRPVKSPPMVSSEKKSLQGPSIVEKIINGQKKKFQLNPSTGKYKEVK